MDAHDDLLKHLVWFEKSMPLPPNTTTFLPLFHLVSSDAGCEVKQFLLLLAAKLKNPVVAVMMTCTCDSDLLPGALVRPVLDAGSSPFWRLPDLKAALAERDHYRVKFLAYKFVRLTVFELLSIEDVTDQVWATRISPKKGGPKDIVKVRLGKVWGRSELLSPFGRFFKKTTQTVSPRVRRTKTPFRRATLRYCCTYIQKTLHLSCANYCSEQDLNTFEKQRPNGPKCCK